MNDTIDRRKPLKKLVAQKAESNRSDANRLQVWSLHPTPVRLIRATTCCSDSSLYYGKFVLFLTCGSSFLTMTSPNMIFLENSFATPLVEFLSFLLTFFPTFRSKLIDQFCDWYQNKGYQFYACAFSEVVTYFISMFSRTFEHRSSCWLKTVNV